MFPGFGTWIPFFMSPVLHKTVPGGVAKGLFWNFMGALVVGKYQGNKSCKRHKKRKWNLNKLEAARSVQHFCRKQAEIITFYWVIFLQIARNKIFTKLFNAEWKLEYLILNNINKIWENPQFSRKPQVLGTLGDSTDSSELEEQNSTSSMSRLIGPTFLSCP